jgi:hypothetical protein
MPVPTASAYVDGAALDDDSTLFGALANQVELSLNGDITDSGTAFVVNEAIAGVAVPCLLIFQTGEIVYCEAKNDGAKQFSSVTRGAGGTTAQAHTSGELVRLFIAAEHYKQIKSAIIAVETVLGVEPQGSFGDVADRLASHDHDGTGDNGTVIDTGDLANHDKTAHDALGIDADTLDSYEGAELRQLWATVDTKTLSSDAIAVDDTHTRYVVAAESGTVDSLATISGGVAGQIVIIEPDAGDTITLVHTTGNLELPGNHNIVLSDVDHKIGLIHDGTDWRVLFDSRVSRVIGIPMPVDQGGSVIVQGYQYFVPGLPFGFIITEATWMGAESGSITLEIYKDVWGTVPTHKTIGADTFTGAGLDDFATGGSYGGYGSKSFRVEIDGVGSPNTYKWSNDGGQSWEATGVAMSAGNFQALEDGVTVKFTAQTGHTLGDRWDFTCNSDRIGYEAVSSARFLKDTSLTNFLVLQVDEGDILELYVPVDATTVTSGTLMLKGYKIGS